MFPFYPSRNKTRVYTFADKQYIVGKTKIPTITFVLVLLGGPLVFGIISETVWMIIVFGVLTTFTVLITIGVSFAIAEEGDWQNYSWFSPCLFNNKWIHIGDRVQNEYIEKIPEYKRCAEDFFKDVRKGIAKDTRDHWLAKFKILNDEAREHLKFTESMCNINSTIDMMKERNKVMSEMNVKI